MRMVNLSYGGHKILSSQMLHLPTASSVRTVLVQSHAAMAWCSTKACSPTIRGVLTL